MVETKSKCGSREKIGTRGIATRQRVRANELNLNGGTATPNVKLPTLRNATTLNTVSAFIHQATVSAASSATTTTVNNVGNTNVNGNGNSANTRRRAAAHGDMKTQNSSPTDSLGKPNTDSFNSSQKCSPESARQHNDEPNTEAVLAALERCSTVAAQRRRLREEQKNSTISSLNAAASQHTNSNGAQESKRPDLFNGATPAGRQRATSNSGSSGRRVLSFRSGGTLLSNARNVVSSNLRTSHDNINSSGVQLPNQSLSSYCRELIMELNALDQMFRYGKLDFTPVHMRRLISQEVQRIESYLSRDESHRFLRPLREALSTVPVLETIGQPPLRIPPAMMQLCNEQTQQDQQQLSSQQQLAQPFLPVPADVRAQGSAKEEISVSTAAEPNDDVDLSADDNDDDFSDSEVDESKKQNLQVDKNVADESQGDGQKLQVTIENDDADELMLLNGYIDNTKTAGDAISALAVADEGISVKPPLHVRVDENVVGEGTPTTFAVAFVSTPSTSVSHRSTPRSSRKSKLPPILEAPEPTPLQVVYTNGFPDDVGFTRKNSAVCMPAAVMSAKIYIPQVEGYNFIGRILGPRGISVRRLENETTCKILIRGRGSVKDPERENQLRNKEGWNHLNDQLHVLITALDDSSLRCRDRLDYAVRSVQRLLTPQYDEYKRQQLMQLAIINGTYRP